MAKGKTMRFSEMDRYLFGEGTHYEIYKLMNELVEKKERRSS